jgi:hypothetical protein
LVEEANKVAETIDRTTLLRAVNGQDPGKSRNGPRRKKNSLETGASKLFF